MTEEFRAIVFGAALVGLVIWLIAAGVNRRYRWLMLAPITWLVHVCLFYAVRIFAPDALSAEWLNVWSSAIRLHSIFITIAVGVYAIAATRRNRL